MREKGLVVVLTGNGKGKTTAALGQALRAAGQGLKVCMIQFIKGAWRTGEAKFWEKSGEAIEFHTLGSGFTWEAEDRSQVIEVARQAWQLAREKVMSGSYDMVILDELTYLLSYEIIKEATVLELLKTRPFELHLVITGRNATQALIEAADLVTEMQEIKHPYGAGLKARKGIEF